MSELEKMARAYCDEAGSMYFEYTDTSNELIDAYESAWNHQQKKIDELEAKLANWNHAVEYRKKTQDLEAKLTRAVEIMNGLRCFMVDREIDTLEAIEKGE